MTMHARILCVQVLSPGGDRVHVARHPGCDHAVHDDHLHVIDPVHGQVHGYAGGTWVQYWYEDSEPQQATQPAEADRLK